MNSFNGPNWSLTWEYVGNILYAFVLRRLPRVLLALFVAAAAFCTLDLSLNLNVFGLLTEGRDAQMYTMIGGWSLTGEQVYIGLTRLFYPFLCGLLISRIGRFITVRGGFWWCSLLLAVLLSVPCVGGEGNVLNGVYNAACILFMDEPEVSLHIEWQQKLISLIRELNPHAQIILTTHSPAVIMNGWLDAVTEVSDISTTH